jgi:hypothetical protein
MVAPGLTTRFLGEIDESVTPDLDVHVVLDNLSAHKAPAVRRWLLRHPRFHFHFTPTYSSWLNLVERFFGLLTEKALKRGLTHEHPATSAGNPPVRRPSQREREAVRVDQVRRGDPRKDAALRAPNAAGARVSGLLIGIADPGD